MDEYRRNIVVMTTFGKKYSGLIDLPNESFRTTDFLNSSTIFWRNPNEKCFDNAIMMHDATLILGSNYAYKKFDKIQIKVSEIIFFYDELENIGDAAEKTRATSMREKTQEQLQTVNIITPVVSNSFYDISGNFYGLFKKKSQDRFIPLSGAEIVEIKKAQGKLTKKELEIPNKFLGVSTQFIEALSVL